LTAIGASNPRWRLEAFDGDRRVEPEVAAPVDDPERSLARKRFDGDLAVDDRPYPAERVAGLHRLPG
jgi:hypothetical protein